MEVEKIETVGIGLEMTDGKTSRNQDKKESIAGIRQQVIDLFYGEIRNFLAVLEPSRKKFDMDNPMAQALTAVMDSDANGKIADHIVFDGSSVTHLSKEGNIVMTMFIDFKQRFNPGSVKDNEENEVANG